jgi:predicted dehydrogenase
MIQGKHQFGGTFAREDRAFIDAVLYRSAPAASGEDGLRALEVLESIQKAIEEHREVSVPHHPV